MSLKDFFFMNYKPYLDKAALELAQTVTKNTSWDPIGRAPTAELAILENKVNYAKQIEESTSSFVGFFHIYKPLNMMVFNKDAIKLNINQNRTTPL